MRGRVLVVGTAATAAIAAVWAREATAMRTAREGAARGAAPGRLGSWLNSRLDGPGYRAFADLLDLRPRDELLDVACGWGEFLLTHAGHVHRVAGVDLTPAKVTLARSRLADRIAAGNAEIVVADAAALPWPDGTFSAVSCMDAFTFLPDPQAVLVEIHRVLRPGGRAAISFAAEKLPPGIESRRARGIATTYTAVSETAARRMMESAGFDPVEVFWTPIAGDHRIAGWVMRLLGADEMDVVVGHKPTRRTG